MTLPGRKYLDENPPELPEEKGEEDGDRELGRSGLVSQTVRAGLAQGDTDVEGVDPKRGLVAEGEVLEPNQEVSAPAFSDDVDPSSRDTPANNEPPPSPPSLQENVPAKGAMKSRMTVVETVYHQVPGQQAQSFESRYTRWLSDEEQTYTRRTKAKEVWERLGFGWVESAAQVCVMNLAPNCNDMKISPEKAEELENNALLIGIVRPTPPGGTGPAGSMWARASAGSEVIAFAVVYPGESCRFEPLNEVSYMVMGRTAGVPFVVNVVPN